ncbi:hypothetical protein EDB84DRAFT_1436441 [Lactarius hengduanensis]|nr:hypothetical protein EDB84DRAFT_1436441 [Lactarius hengduanensis]
MSSSGLYPNTPPQTEGRSRVNNIFAWRKERDGVLAYGSGSSPRLAQELALGSGSGLHITSMRCLVRPVSRISSDASPFPPLRMRRSFWDYGGRNECAPKRHNLPVGGPLSTLPGLVVTASLWLRAASVLSRETHRLKGPTSTILPSPDTTDRHPFYGLYVGLGTFTESAALRQHQSASGLNLPIAVSRHILRLEIRSRYVVLLDPSVLVTDIVIARIEQQGLRTRGEDVARGSHQVSLLPQLFLRSARLWRIAVCLALANTAADYCQTSDARLRLPYWKMMAIVRANTPWIVSRLCVVPIGVPYGRSVCADFSNSPSHCVFGAITTIGSGKEMESENGKLGGDFSNNFRSSRRQVLKAVLVYSSLCPCVSHAGIFHPLQARKGMVIGFLGITLPPCTRREQVWTFACLHGNRRRGFPARNVTEAVNVAGVSALSQKIFATIEYGSEFEIRVLRWGLSALIGDVRLHRCLHALGSIRCCEVLAQSTRDIHGVGRHVARSARDIHGIRLTLIGLLNIAMLRSSVRTYMPCGTSLYASGVAATSTCFVSTVGVSSTVWWIFALHERGHRALGNYVGVGHSKISTAHSVLNTGIIGSKACLLQE